MSFSKNLTITVRNTTAQLNEPLCVYEKDRNLMVYFKIMDYKYKFDKNPTNVLASVDDIMEAYATIVDPNGYELTRRYGEVVDDEIKFVITEDLIDEIEEIGTYKLQFHIKCQHSEFTIPEISFEVLERLKGIRTVTDEGVVGDTILNNAESFIDAEGKLNLVWQRGDTISSVRLNQMVEVINNAVDEEHQRQINEVNRENRANAKLNELETRFSALTTSQQQSAEVIDARDGEASLKARLDRDIEKAKQIYVDVEGSNISTDSAAGYLKDVEILGNTLVNLTTAHAVVGTGSNTKYTFDGEYYSIQKTNGYTLGISFKSRNDKLEANKTYTIIINNKSEIQTFLYNADYAKISNLSNGVNIIKYTPSSSQLIRVGDVSNNSTEGLIKFSILILEGDHTQNPPSYFEGIASVGDRVDGQELYEIPVLSCGKNLFNTSKLIGGSFVEFKNKPMYKFTDGNKPFEFTGISYLENTAYTLSIRMFRDDDQTSKLANIIIQYTDGSVTDVLIGSGEKKHISTDPNKTVAKIKGAFNYSSNVYIDLEDLQIEEGTVATPYEPYVEDKLTILSPVQLEKVGDVADRVVCKDGVWGVEKNIGEIVLNGSEEWAENLGGVAPQPNTRAYGITLPSAKGLDSEMDGYSNILPYNKSLGTIDDVECFKINSVKNLYVRILKSRVASTSEFKKWLEINNMLVKYQLATPTFIPLPHDQQIRLRTFANKTNISFLTTIEGTIKAQVPKSLGSTVNIQNEQISNLNKELDRVKKLEESTVSTVETESDFTTVEATSNGYFEDVKLEGKTLVNKFVFNEGYATDSTVEIVCKDYKSLCYGKFTIPNLFNKDIGINIYDKDTDRFIRNIPIQANSSVMVDLDKENAYLYNIYGGKISGWTDYEELKSKAMFIEGDHTQNPPSYFEGLKSVGDGADEIVVESVKGDGNLVDPNLLLDTYQTCFIPRNTTFTVSCDVFNRIDNNYVRIYFYDKNKTQIDYFNLTVRTVDKRNYRTFTIASDIHYIQFKTMNVALNSSNYAINIGNDYILKPYQSDKKRLLYYNPETQVWGKPILREWDSIEKHADGKYYYHQRSGEVVLNGSEDWGLQSDTAWETDTHISFYYRIANMRPNIWGTESVSICDRFNTITANNSNYTDSNEFSSTDYHKFNIKILKSKLSTLDSNGFKQWLQANNVTAVYQLAEEKVYECTNIDLITYANETNYIVNSGAITPKSALKVHNNISNVVNLLQKKVSILESNFITMFKAVLSGDYQTLAYSLYPEDFNSQEDNSIQNNIQEDTNNQE